MSTLLRKKIQTRAQFLQKTREFFTQRKLLEVDTALFREFSVTDPYMSAYQVSSPDGKHCGYLQTSPEYAMKQLLCEGAGDIFQLGKMFRANESSPIHAGEFTMLEWYRIGYDHLQLATEVCELIEFLIGKKKINRLTYQQAFMQALSIDPFTISYSELCQTCEDLLGEIPAGLLMDNYLTLLFAEKVETQFDPNAITVISDFPESQASLATTRIIEGIAVADRFEIYLAGVELANGFNELTDAAIQLARFQQDNQIRKTNQLPSIEIDKGFIQALNKGLPECAGVAVGFDRLLMIATENQSLDQVIYNEF